jgi:hypothetical protein
LAQLEKRLGITFKPIKKAKGETKPRAEKKKKNRPYKAYDKKATHKKPGAN